MCLNFEEVLLCVLLITKTDIQIYIHTYHSIMQIYDFCHITSSDMCVITFSTILHKMALEFFKHQYHMM
jgi:hypothetical protein